MENKHTPGPWEAKYWSNNKITSLYSIHHADKTILSGKRICDLNKHTYDSRIEEAKANARLIAAAPDMLEALKEFCEYIESIGDDDKKLKHYPTNLYLKAKSAFYKAINTK